MIKFYKCKFKFQHFKFLTSKMANNDNTITSYKVELSIMLNPNNIIVTVYLELDGLSYNCVHVVLEALFAVVYKLY